MNRRKSSKSLIWPGSHRHGSHAQYAILSELMIHTAIILWLLKEVYICKHWNRYVIGDFLKPNAIIWNKNCSISFNFSVMWMCERPMIHHFSFYISLYKYLLGLFPMYLMNVEYVVDVYTKQYITEVGKGLTRYPPKKNQNMSLCEALVKIFVLNYGQEKNEG